MGENLALNIESRGFEVAVFNRTVARVDAFIAGKAKGKNIIGAHAIPELIEKLETPRKIILMVKAGETGRCIYQAVGAAPLQGRSGY